MSRPRFSFEGSGRGAIAMAVLAFACAGASCTRSSTPQSEQPDAAVTFQSAVVTNPASWNNLWGSWPAARYDHAMSYDSDTKRIVMFGGRQQASGPHYADLWEWDTTKGAWNQRTPPGTVPYDRSGHAMVYNTMTKKTVMFSGWQPTAVFWHPEWWEWDSPNQTWTKHALAAGTDPSPRFGAAMVWDSTRNRIVLFGGSDERSEERRVGKEC